MTNNSPKPMAVFFGGVVAGAMVMLVIGGAVAAALVWQYLHEVKMLAQENWEPVVVAIVDIPPQTKVTREMMTITRIPRELIVPQAVLEIKEAEGRTAKVLIRAREQFRQDDFVGP